MKQTITATYKEGVFHPDKPCDLPEGTRVQLAIADALVLPPRVSDDAERARILKRVADRMKHNPVAPDTPKLTREQLRERR